MQACLQASSINDCLWLRVCLTWPIDEITVTQPSNFHPLEKKHSGSDVRLKDVRHILNWRGCILQVQTETLP